MRSAVVLVDPDDGLEVKSSRPGNFHKYVTYAEVRNLYKRMDDGSVLILYQHHPRVHRKTLLYHLHYRIQKELRCPLPVTVSDGQIALIAIARNVKRRQQVEKAVSDYLRRDLLMCS